MVSLVAFFSRLHDIYHYILTKINWETIPETQFIAVESKRLLNNATTAVQKLKKRVK